MDKNTLESLKNAREEVKRLNKELNDRYKNGQPYIETRDKLHAAEDVERQLIAAFEAEVDKIVKSHLSQEMRELVELYLEHRPEDSIYYAIDFAAHVLLKDQEFIDRVNNTDYSEQKYIPIRQVIEELERKMNG